MSLQQSSRVDSSFDLDLVASFFSFRHIADLLLLFPLSRSAPFFFFLSFLIHSYNATGTPYRQPPDVDSSSSSPDSPSSQADEHDDDKDEENDLEARSEEDLKKKKKKKKKKPAHVPGDEWCRRRKNRDKIVCQPRIPRHADGESPSRKNTFGTPLGYAQVSEGDELERLRRGERE